MEFVQHWKCYSVLCLWLFSGMCFAAAEVDVSGHWQGDIHTSGAKPLHKSIALSLQQAEDSSVSGYVFYEDDRCVFSVEGQVLTLRRQQSVRVDIREQERLTGVLQGCLHQTIAHAISLSPAEQKLSLSGSHLGQMIQAEKSFVYKRSDGDFADRLKQVETLKAQKKRQAKQWTGAVSASMVTILWPGGYASPQRFYVLADKIHKRGGDECAQSLYYQDGASGELAYLSDAPQCDLLPKGRFNVEAQDRLTITWLPSETGAREQVLVDQDIAYNYQRPMNGTLWQLQAAFQHYSDSKTLPEIATLLQRENQATHERIKNVAAQRLAVTQYTPEFMGAWQGHIRFRLPNKSEHHLEQAALALWLSRLGERSHIMGYLTISESCLFSVQLDDRSGAALLHARPERLQAKCDQRAVKFTLPNPLKLSMDAEHRLLKLEPQATNAGASSFEGVFERQKPTPYMASLLDVDIGQKFSLPEQAQKTRMMSALVPDDGLVEQHDQAIEGAAKRIAKLGEEVRARQARSEALERARLQREREYAAVAQQKQGSGRANITPEARDSQPIPEVKGPFDDLPGATFLNAIYKGDKALVQRINQSYSRKQAAGLKAFFGSSSNRMTDGLADLYRFVKIQDSVAAKYLFEYERRYARCLSKSAAIFYVTGYQPDTVITNLLGAEIARHYGGTTTTQYQVNHEFVPVFRKVGKMQPEGAAANITGWLASQGSKDLRKESLKGVAGIFGKFACDSPEIKTFEKNLIALF